MIVNTIPVFSFKIYIPEMTLSFDFLSAEITKKFLPLTIAS